MFYLHHSKVTTVTGIQRNWSKVSVGETDTLTDRTRKLYNLIKITVGSYGGEVKGVGSSVRLTIQYLLTSWPAHWQLSTWPPPTWWMRLGTEPCTPRLAYTGIAFYGGPHQTVDMSSDHRLQAQCWLCGQINDHRHGHQLTLTVFGEILFQTHQLDKHHVQGFLRILKD